MSQDLKGGDESPVSNHESQRREYQKPQLLIYKNLKEITAQDAMS